MTLRAEFNAHWNCWTLIKGNGQLFAMSAIKGQNATVAGNFKNVAATWNLFNPERLA